MTCCTYSDVSFKDGGRNLISYILLFQEETWGRDALVICLWSSTRSMV